MSTFYLRRPCFVHFRAVDQDGCLELGGCGVVLRGYGGQQLKVGPSKIKQLTGAKKGVVTHRHQGEQLQVSEDVEIEPLTNHGDVSSSDSELGRAATIRLSLLQAPPDGCDIERVSLCKPR
jgi:hypothetical protein